MSAGFRGLQARLADLDPFGLRYLLLIEAVVLGLLVWGWR